MRSLLIASEITYPVTAVTTTSTAVVLFGPLVGTPAIGQEGPPGEDMAFATASTAVGVIELEGVTSNASDVVGFQVSVDYYAKTVAGGSPTFAASKSYTLPTVLTTKNKTIFIDRVPLGEAIRAFVTATGTGGAGTFSAYLLAT